jgi:hypothetical protein
MPRSGNRTGTAYSLTVFARIRAGQEDEVRTHIDSLPMGADSPLARLDMLHFSRLQVFSELVYQGRPQRPDRLEHSHLVFTSSFDGELDPYLDAICERLGRDADAWWRHCEGFPGTADRARFRSWIREQQVDSALFAVAVTAEVPLIRDSLALRDQVVEFAAEAQGLDDVSLQRRFEATFLEDAPR